MVKVCCVGGCKVAWRPVTDISFFSFPLKNKELLDKWLQVIPTNNRISKYSRICCNHFKELDYDFISGKRILTKDAVPSIFLYNAANNEEILTKNPAPIVFQPAPLKDLSNCIANELRNENTLKEATVSKPVSIVVSTSFSTDQAIQATVSVKDVATQVSPKKLKPLEDDDKLCRKIRILQNRLRRRELKISSVCQLLKHLKKEGKSSEKLKEILLKRFPGFNLELFHNEIKNSNISKTSKRYSEKMKEFASTFYFYSPKAYNFVRSKLNLPHEATLRKWIGESSCEAGFMTGVFDFLKKESTNSNYMKDVALVIDEMSIRSQIALDKKENRYRGFVDYGTAAQELNINCNDTDLASDVLVFQIVSYSTKFKIPIAHFFVKGISAETQSKLLLAAVEKLYDVGVLVRSITCDGASVNFTTFKNLGCSFDLENIKTSFKHPRNNSDIHVIFDPCHMIKLCRNTFAQKQMRSAKGNISFEYIKELHKIQEAEGFKFANRLSSSHVNFKNKKMKVNLATQTISSSVANAIDYLRAGKCTAFANSEATSEFLQIFDMLFDILNSRNAYGKGYKSPLSLSNFKYWDEVFNDTEIYIRSLMIEDQLLLQHGRKTFALGFLIDIKSVRLLVLDLLNNIHAPLKYVLTYKFSQDRIELYFCCLRSRGGWNNNPSIMQILWSIRRLLYRNSIQPSLNANCLSENFESSSILDFRSTKRSTCENVCPDDTVENDDVIDILDNINVSSFQENILYYITGNIVSKFMKKCTCSHCQDILLSPSNLQDHIIIQQTSITAPDFLPLSIGENCASHPKLHLELLNLVKEFLKQKLMLVLWDR